MTIKTHNIFLEVKPEHLVKINENVRKPTTAEFKYLRIWQAECINQLENEKKCLIQAATGAGKSLAMMVLIYKKLIANPKSRAIIAASYTDICEGFSNPKNPFNVIVDDKECKIRVGKNFAGDTLDKVQGLIDFLNLADISQLNLDSRICVVTHACLSAAYAKERTAFDKNDLVLVIDEAHHSSSGDIQNSLSKVIESVCNHNGDLIMATATFIRGDNDNILTEELEKDLKVYKYSIDKHLRDSKSLKSYSMDIGLCGGTEDIISDIKAKLINHDHTIIWIPHTNNLYAIGVSSKEEFVKLISDAIREVRPELPIVDLVGNGIDDSVLSKFDADKLKNGGVVIAMNKFKEGSDYPKASQGIIIGQRNSITDFLQMIGRLFRDCDGKNHVDIHQILTWNFDRAEGDENLKEDVNNWFKVINSFLLYKSILAPKMLKGKKEINPETGEETAREHYNYLAEVTKTTEELSEVHGEMNQKILELTAEKGGLKANDIVEVAEDIIEKFELEADPELLAEYFYKLWKPKKFLNGIEAGEIDFNFLSDEVLLSEDEVFDVIGSISIGQKDLKTFVEAMDKMFVWDGQLDEFIRRAELVHGVGTFDYSLIKKEDIKNSQSKLKIKCSCKKIFLQRIHDHLQGAGCSRCARSEKYTTETFIKKAKEIHGNKFCYESANYINSKTKVNIKCLTCNSDFYQTPAHHLGGQGCLRCSGKEKSNTEEFIIKAKEKHGDKYCYDMSNYITANTKVNIKCLTCNKMFSQKPGDHLQGKGCLRCSGLEKSTTENFIIKAKEVHGDTFCYNLVNYINSNTKVKIKCLTCNEIFTQTPNSHLQEQGCLRCSGKKQHTTKTFIVKAKEVHGDKFCYKLVDYINAYTKINIKCTACNTIFTQVPGGHLYGRGCLTCSGKEKKTTEYFIKKSKEIHGDKYSYDLVDYINNKTKVEIKCMTCNKNFSQEARRHIQGQGCPDCAKSKMIQSRRDNLLAKKKLKDAQ